MGLLSLLLNASSNNNKEQYGRQAVISMPLPVSPFICDTSPAAVAPVRET